MKTSRNVYRFIRSAWGLWLSGVLSLLLALGVQAAERPQSPLLLWPEREAVTPDREREEEARIYQVDNPSMTPYWPAPELANGTAVVVFPGGGYRRLAWDKEGEEVARWLNTQGIAAFVVKYRMVDYGHPAPLLDGLRAVRYVRAHAANWGLARDRIGVLGFSAGGHLAGSVALRADFAHDALVDDPWALVSARPDFAVLVYPVVTLEGEDAHAGSREALLGANPDAASVRENSLQYQVGAATPPLFLVHGAGDRSVPVSNSLKLFEAARRHISAVELHVYQTDVHGFGLRPDQGSASAWPEVLVHWLHLNAFLPGN